MLSNRRQNNISGNSMTMVIKKAAANKAMVQRPPESRYRLSMFLTPF